MTLALASELIVIVEEPSVPYASNEIDERLHLSFPNSYELPISNSSSASSFSSSPSLIAVSVVRMQDRAGCRCAGMSFSFSV